MRHITFFLLLLAMAVQAQKSAPVAGHAARLVDLLKKDYNTVDVATRREVMLKDMDEAISIFKIYVDNKKLGTEDINSYTTTTNGENLIVLDLSAEKIYRKLKDTTEKKKYDKTYFSDYYETSDVNDVSTALKHYKQASENYISISKAYASVNTLTNTMPDTLYSLQKDLNFRKEAYEKVKFKFNLSEFVRLVKHFQNVESENKYLAYMLDVFIIKYYEVNQSKSDKFAQANYNSSIQKALPFFGGDLSFETAIDGLSRFLAKRIKEELTVHAIEKIQDYLNNPEPQSYLNELMVLLPTTTGYLKSFKFSQALSFTDDIKQYIEQDLNSLLTNAPKLRHTSRFKKYIDKNPDLDFAFEALELIPQLSKIENPIDYFDILENSSNIQRWGAHNEIAATSNAYDEMLKVSFQEIAALSVVFASSYPKRKPSLFELRNAACLHAILLCQGVNSPALEKRKISTHLKQAIDKTKDEISKNRGKLMRYDIANTVKFASLLAHSLVIVEDGKPKFASTSFMSNYANEINFYLLYIGFLHEQNERYYNISYTNDGNIQDLNFSVLMNEPKSVTQSDPKFKSITNNLTSIAENAEKLHNSLTNIKKANKAGEEVGAEKLHAFFGDMIDFSEQVVSVADTLARDTELKLISGETISSQRSTKSEPYFKTARTVNDIFLDLHKTNYTTAIIKAIEIPTTFKPKTKDYKVYSDILQVTQNIATLKNLHAIKKLMALDRVYTVDLELRQEQLNLAIFIDASFKTSDTKSDNLTSKYESIYQAIEKKNNTAYIKAKTTFREAIEKDWKTVFKYAGVDIDSFRIRLDSLLEQKGIKEKVDRNSIISEAEKVFKDALLAYIFEDHQATKNLDESQKIMIMRLRVLIPEMFPDVFSFKDDNVVKLIHFVNDMAQAGDAEDVETALSNFALPAGSSSMKEDAVSYVSVNAYPGLMGGITWNDFNGEDKTYNFGFTAPIGFYLQPWKSGSTFTVGLFIPVIDIAAPVRFRHNEDNDNENLPDFEFKDIFSPGAYLSIGFNNTPFALNIGGQYGPGLSSIEKDTENDTEPKAIKTDNLFYWNLGITIDIPLFSLHARSKD